MIKMLTTKLTKRDVEEKPYCIWNSFVELLSNDYNELSPDQRPAHLVFLYENEVQNGGHLQYFENRGVEYLEATVEALGILGASCQQQVLREAGELFFTIPRGRIRTVEEYVSSALADGFGSLDRRFGQCSPSLQQCLERHLEEHQDKFVTVA
jgi:hypothetical protein